LIDHLVGVLDSNRKWNYLALNATPCFGTGKNLVPTSCDSHIRERMLPVDCDSYKVNRSAEGVIVRENDSLSRTVFTIIHFNPDTE
jgi:hypothetical protein